MMIPTFDGIIEITIIITLGRVQMSYENKIQRLHFIYQKYLKS